jgi:hypothetical protein
MVAKEPMKLLAWIAAHPEESAGLFYLFVCVVVGALPVRARRWPVVGFAVRLADRLSFLKMRDAEGTLSWPVIGRSALDAARPAPLDESKGEVLR